MELIDDDDVMEPKLGVHDKYIERTERSVERPS